MADCVTNKIDSNVTGLSFAEEVCAKQLPTLADDGHDPVWHEVEPNEYDNFGVEIETMAREPISRTRQRKKGTPVDLDGNGGFNMDLTKNNHNRLFQGFYFADWHEKPTTFPMNDDQILITGITASNDRYTAAAGMGQFKVNMLVFVSGCINGANNGLKLVDEVTATYIGVGDGTVDETGTDDVVITAVGYKLVAGDASIVMSGSLAVLTLATNVVVADATLTIASAQNADPDETVTIGGVVYTFKVAADAAYEVTIGGSRLSTLTNLATVINGGHLLTPAHPLVSATANGDGTMDIDARIGGVTGNGIVTAEVMAQGSWDGNTAGGTGFSFYALDVIPGEWVFLGGDDADNTFANNVGYGRVKTVTDKTITFDKTSWDPEAESAGALDIHVYTGSFIRNEPDADDVVTRYYQWERTLGRDADGTQAEYLTGTVANEATVTIEQADKINVDLSFIAADGETRTGAEGLKTGTRVAALGQEAINTSSDVYRMRMSLVSTVDSLPSPLFAYITEGELSINNNVDPVKVIGAMGGIDVSVGNFDVEGEVTALFTTVAAIRAIRQSADVTLDFILAKSNYGMVFDIPLLTLGNGQVAIELNSPVTIPLGIMGAECPLGYTMSYTQFDYLPTAAMPVNGVSTI